jgi:hypothetical protein
MTARQPEPEPERERHDADHCPRCGRKITDYDTRGRELDSGQRECNGPCPGADWAWSELALREQRA